MATAAHADISRFESQALAPGQPENKTPARNLDIPSSSDNDGASVTAILPARSLRQRPRRASMVDCPGDVLCLIFGCVATNAADAYDAPYLEDGNAMWNCDCDMIQQPINNAALVLAAVCRSWRREAVSLSALWSFITVPPWPTSSAVHFVNLMVERSRQAPLDFRLHWYSIDEFSAECTNAILDRFAGAAPRWRTVHFGVDVSYLKQYLPKFCAPTPLLEDLRFCVTPNYSEYDPSDLLEAPLFPDCARLRKFQTDFPELVYRPGYTQLSSLTHLDCSVTLCYSDVCDVLRGCPLLEHLTVYLSMLDIAVTPRFAVSLPRLRFLACAGFMVNLVSRWIDYFHMPSLTTLDLNCPYPEWVPAIAERLCKTVTVLRYSNGDTGQCRMDAAALACFSRLRVVRLEGRTVAAFFSQLDDLDAWPLLETLTLLHPGEALIRKAKEVLWDFLRARRMSVYELDGELKYIPLKF